jgi:hypothetical protein
LAQKGGRKPINAKCETVHSLPTFRDAYRRRRCILPVDGFFEWKAIKGHTAKQPHAIAMKNGSPFGIGGLWENWKDPTSGCSARGGRGPGRGKVALADDRQGASAARGRSGRSKPRSLDVISEGIEPRGDLVHHQKINGQNYNSATRTLPFA